MMGFLYEGLTIESFLALVAFIAVFLFLNEISRRSKTVSLLMFVLLPVLLALGIFFGPLGSPTGKTWFGWVKVVSALIGVYGFLLIRFTKLGTKKFAAIFPAAILSINIAEAVFRELEIFATYKTLTVDAGGIVVQGGPWNILNAIAGVFTIITLTGFVGIRVSKDKSRDMIWPDMTWPYVIGYTLWNYAYVYNCISTRSLYAGFGILTAAIIAEYFFKRGAWLQHRAQILSLYAMFSLSVDFQTASFFQVLPTYSPGALMSLSIVSFVFNLGVFFFMVYTMRQKKANPIRQELYRHTDAYKKTLTANGL
ncbi:hypothetical protein KCG48_07135 [Proteiniclasticum sp. BAD-10]|uniref:Uncharacterized protein n=1 Tax=Proteiniclasticum sediminis TaxID=2804028 RepID=A0A941CQ98_9CLOT|nr:DUF5692 family protein [Proteiniclasticum sediminis]MBR0576114.1 hypothetical protein [Proteiniclasticum sediminis]